MGRADFYLEGLQCSVCKETKPKSEFTPRKDCVRGYTYACKQCRLVQISAWKKRNPEHFSEYIEQNKNMCNALTRQRRAKDNTRFKEYSRRSYQKHRASRLEWNKEHYEKNRPYYAAKVALRKSRK